VRSREGLAALLEVEVTTNGQPTSPSVDQQALHTLAAGRRPQQQAEGRAAAAGGPAWEPPG
jgi:hypothetical protein